MLEHIAVLVKIFKKVCWNIFDDAAMSQIVLSVFRVLLPPPPRHTCMSIHGVKGVTVLFLIVVFVVVDVVVFLGGWVAATP